MQTFSSLTSIVSGSEIKKKGEREFTFKIKINRHYG